MQTIERRRATWSSIAGSAALVAMGPACSSPDPAATADEGRGAILGSDPRCADGTADQVFFGGMVGCAGDVTWANRATLCGASYRTARSNEKDGLGGYEVPIAPFWLEDNAVAWSNGTIGGTVGTLCVPDRGCADGSAEQVFPNGM